MPTAISSTVVSTATTTTVAGRPKKKRAMKPSMRTPSTTFSAREAQGDHRAKPDLSLAKFKGAARREGAAPSVPPTMRRPTAREARKGPAHAAATKTKRTPSSYLFRDGAPHQGHGGMPDHEDWDCSALRSGRPSTDRQSRYIDKASELKRPPRRRAGMSCSQRSVRTMVVKKHAQECTPNTTPSQMREYADACKEGLLEAVQGPVVRRPLTPPRPRAAALQQPGRRSNRSTPRTTSSASRAKNGIIVATRDASSRQTLQCACALLVCEECQQAHFLRQ